MKSCDPRNVFFGLVDFRLTAACSRPWSRAKTLGPKPCSHRLSLNVARTIRQHPIFGFHPALPRDIPSSSHFLVFLLNDLGKNPSWGSQNDSQAFWASSEIRDIFEAKGRSVSGLPNPTPNWKKVEIFRGFKYLWNEADKPGLLNTFIQILL